MGEDGAGGLPRKLPRGLLRVPQHRVRPPVLNTSPMLQGERTQELRLSQSSEEVQRKGCDILHAVAKTSLLARCRDCSSHKRSCSWDTRPKPVRVELAGDALWQASHLAALEHND